MSNDHAVVDDFESGFVGEEVVATTPPEPDNKGAASLDEFEITGDKPEPATEAPTASSEPPATESASPPVDTPKTRSITEEEYQTFVSYGQSLEQLKAEVAKRNDQLFGKMGAMEQLIQKAQQATPRGETPRLTKADMGKLAENYEYLSDDLLEVLNTALSKLEGTGGAPVAAVDQTQIAELVNGGITQALPSITAQIKEQVKREVEYERVLEAHADADEVFQAPGFRQFLSALPEDRRKVIESSWDSKIIIPALNEYKKSIEKPAPAPATPDPAPSSRKDALRAAINPVGTPSLPKKPLTEDDEFELGFSSD